MIYHITARANWQQANIDGIYSADSLHTEGFIHLSTDQQVIKVANFLYKGRNDLVLLVVDSDQLTPTLKWEDSHSNGELFPHAYGRINLDAVVDVLEFPCSADGTFMLPF